MSQHKTNLFHSSYLIDYHTITSQFIKTTHSKSRSATYMIPKNGLQLCIRSVTTITSIYRLSYYHQLFFDETPRLSLITKSYPTITIHDGIHSEVWWTNQCNTATSGTSIRSFLFSKLQMMWMSVFLHLTYMPTEATTYDIIDHTDHTGSEKWDEYNGIISESISLTVVMVHWQWWCQYTMRCISQGNFFTPINSDAQGWAREEEYSW